MNNVHEGNCLLEASYLMRLADCVLAELSSQRHRSETRGMGMASLTIPIVPFPITITMTSFITPQVCRAFRAAPKAAPWTRLGTQLPRAQPAFRRFFAAPAQEQPRLRLGSTGTCIGIHTRDSFAKLTFPN